MFFPLRKLFSIHYVSLRKKCPYSELFWFAFSRIQTEYSVSLRIQSECEKIQTIKTPNTDALHAVYIMLIEISMSSLLLHSKFLLSFFFLLLFLFFFRFKSKGSFLQIQGIRKIISLNCEFFEKTNEIPQTKK